MIACRHGHDPPKGTALSARPDVALSIDSGDTPDQARALSIRRRASRSSTAWYYLAAARKTMDAEAAAEFEQNVRGMYDQMYRDAVRDRTERKAAMPNVIVDITVSLDGFVTGEHADEQQELGDPPEPTREHAAGCGDTEILEHATAASGAAVRGRRFSEAYPIGDLLGFGAHRKVPLNAGLAQRAGMTPTAGCSKMPAPAATSSVGLRSAAAPWGLARDQLAGAKATTRRR